VEAQAIEPFSGARMTSPWTIFGLLTTAFVAGAVPTGLLAIRQALGDHTEATAACLRRNLLVPAVFFLPLAGALSEHWIQRDIALFGIFVAIVGLGLTALMPQTQNALTNMVGVSFGLSLLAVGAIALMPIGLTTPGRDVEAINLGFAALGLGWLVGPKLAEAGVRWGGAPRTLLFQAAALLVVFGLLAVVPIGVAVEGTLPLPAPDPDANIAIDLRFWVLGLALLLYLPIASSIEAWSRPLIRELADGREPAVDRRLNLFWIAFLASRILPYFAMRSGLEAWVLVACAVAGVIVLGNLAGVHQLSSASVGLTIVGLSFGPLLPGIFGLIHSNLPHAGLVLGSALGVATLWHLLGDPVLGRMLSSWSPRSTMRVLLLPWLGLCATLLLAALMQPEPVKTPRAPREIAKKNTLGTYLRKLFTRHKS
jgi:hypothetical protein